MKTKSNYLMVFLIITFGVDVLDRHMKIEYITVPIILIIMLIVFVQIIYYSFFKGLTRKIISRTANATGQLLSIDKCATAL